MHRTVNSRTLISVQNGDILVIVLSVVLCQLVYWWYVTSTKAAAVWWGPVLALVVAFYVAFLAMYGWEKLAQLWARYKHTGGSA